MFEVGDHLFATDIRNVKEVLELADTTPIPGSVPGVLGLINVRGMMVVAADMATLLGLTSRGSPESALVLLEAGGRRVALRVDRVSGITGEASPDLDVEGELLEALGAREVTLGVGRTGSRPYYELDVEAVFGRVLEPDRPGRREPRGG
jgi:purine-binding chemotaxis protein CheW